VISSVHSPSVRSRMCHRHDIITSICPVRGEPPAPHCRSPCFFLGRPPHPLTSITFQPRPLLRTSIMNRFFCEYIHYNRIEMTVVVMLRVFILVENWLRNESGSVASDRTSAGECRAHPFFHFRNCLTTFFVDSFAPCHRH
jgi:hypothetical protein